MTVDYTGPRAERVARTLAFPRSGVYCWGYADSPRTCVVTLVTAAVVLTLVPAPAVAQSTDRTMPMRTPDGQPDISGIFTFRTLTPFQRPRQFEGQATLSPEDAAAFEASERRRQNRDLFDPETGAAGYAPRSEGGRALVQTNSGTSGAST